MSPSARWVVRFQGRGLHTARFKQYEPMPRNVQDQIAAEAKRAKEEADG